MNKYSSAEDTIIALATAPGVGAIAVIRLSGKEAFSIAAKMFRGKDPQSQPSHTLHFGTIRDGKRIIDEVVLSLFKGPKSFTKEDVVEISCHGSQYIVKEIIQLSLKHGARLARPGEFTMRAFMNGQFDLAQAEAVADLINADSDAAHSAALSQMRGGFSKEIDDLRTELINFASLIELELDFSEEDVEFAQREELRALVEKLYTVISKLLKSFDYGNVIKKGIPTVIAGKPNAGKSTLLNALLNEEKAIVSDIPGTTRDFIEDEMVIEGVSFRFIDTAGIRETIDKIEAMGVAKTHEKMGQASLILYLFDLSTDSISDVLQEVNRLENLGKPFIAVGNKIDIAPEDKVETLRKNDHFVFISAGKLENIDDLKDKISEKVHLDNFKTGDTMVTNARHYEALLRTQTALQEVLRGLDLQVTNDFLAMDIRQALHHLGEITGQITTDDLLGNIFSKFCIGK
ncbi:tRNA uridine-5-carboxymethylaminomethyl(34) synthesis GTPase MnmE [Marinigracilibium pacificum]|uniref:tRNA modification GTPase MnmE n=1 Tax=Marinigracilibium pacificum TaxID=2729599 RepID=A0A848J2W2_9BACT|nr:tRNA uridine-5-carboxymethylaminomethyl(34) synthesis GTPase MnmE [Marinigracilibium pacificum]NMM49845.1 tRNA uridine-5-carboxymethylaminomethyl(34) synthesis GTPase MnmE [Marinigracilibium pacificum]